MAHLLVLIFEHMTASYNLKELVMRLPVEGKVTLGETAVTLREISNRTRELHSSGKSQYIPHFYVVRYCPHFRLKFLLTHCSWLQNVPSQISMRSVLGTSI